MEKKPYFTIRIMNNETGEIVERELDREQVLALNCAFIDAPLLLRGKDAECWNAEKEAQALEDNYDFLTATIC